MKVKIEVDLQTKDKVKEILEKTDYTPFFALGEKLWKEQCGEFEINIPGGKLIYKQSK